jgi:hypothetical protein
VSHSRQPADVNLRYTALQDVNFSQIGSGDSQGSVKRSQPIAKKMGDINDGKEESQVDVTISFVN